MITIRDAHTRGKVYNEWISSNRTFSNNSYKDTRYNNFGHLQVINDDVVRAGRRTPPHPHVNIEIYGYVVDGECLHMDNIGNTVIVPAGSIQLMSSGTGFMHSEGATSSGTARYIQIWINTAERDTAPQHSVAAFTREEKLNQFAEVTAKLPVKQDAKFFAGIFDTDFSRELSTERQYYVYVVRGIGKINNLDVTPGSGLSYVDETTLTISPTEELEVLLFDLLKV